MRVTIKRGYDLPIEGAPVQSITAAPAINSVALSGLDYPGLRPAFEAAVGDRVRTGQTLFTDRKNKALQFTSPGCGWVSAIHTGTGNRLQSIVIRLGTEEPWTFDTIPATALASAASDTIRNMLLASGLWTGIRQRPFNRVADPDVEPAAVFISVMDSNPLAADPEVVIQELAEDFYHGLLAISRLAAVPLYICTASDSTLDPARFPEKATAVSFAGPHPAGLAGTHIHHLAPVTTNRPAWTIGFQDLIAIGRLLTSGRIMTDRVIAVAGPGVRNPGLLRSRIGANIPELLAGQLQQQSNQSWRVISGSILSGREIQEQQQHLGRYHQQISVIPEAGVAHPRTVKPSVIHNQFRPILNNRKPRTITTARPTVTSGMLPVEAFDQVWALESPVAPLLRALLVGDIDSAIALGCLDLAEADLALCSYLCPGNQDYGTALREVLGEIERQG